MKELMGGRQGTHEGNGAVSDLAASSEDMPRSGSGNGVGVRIEHPDKMAETKRAESITATVFMTGISDVRLLPPNASSRKLERRCSPFLEMSINGIISHQHRLARRVRSFMHP